MNDLADLKRIGHYLLIRSVGSTAYSHSYESTNPSSGAKCRVTGYLRDFVATPGFADRFRQQAVIAQGLEGISTGARVLDHGLDDTGGFPYIVSELPEGETLAEKLNAGIVFSPDQVMQWLGDAAEALVRLHQASGVHRDLRPGSILVTPGGNGRLLNLGQGGLLPLDQFRLGREVYVGSPLYLPPEVALGQSFTARSDIYAFACLAFHALTGQPPYSGTSPEDIIRMHSGAPIPRLSAIYPDLPTSVGEILYEAMAKEPANRYMAMDMMLIDWRGVTKEVISKVRQAGSGRNASSMSLPKVGTRELGSIPTSSMPLLEDEDYHMPTAGQSRSAGAVGGISLRMKSPEDEAPPLDPGFDDQAAAMRLPTSSNLSINDDLLAIMPRKMAGIGTEALKQPGSLPGSGSGLGGSQRDIYGRTDAAALSRLKAAPEPQSGGILGYVFIGILLLAAVIGGITVWHNGGINFRSLTGSGPDPEAEATRQEWRRWVETRTRIQEMPFLILQFERSEGRKPSMADLERSGFATSEQIRDGWGATIIYDAVNDQIISTGSDRTRRTGDDFIYDVGKNKFSSLPREPDYIPTGEEEQQFSTYRK